MLISYKENWELIFELTNLGAEMDEPLTAKILSDPNHVITRHILYIYSMESFIYADMNRACRDKDKSKIKFYGAFAAALSYIIYNANKNRKDREVVKQTKLYRGIKMQAAEVEGYDEGALIQLTGYTSTSKQFATALQFAFAECMPGQVPVVFEIIFKGKSGMIELDDDITAYPGEQEVLLQDGLQYKVLQKIETQSDTT